MPWGRVDDTYYDHPKLEELVEVHEWPDRVVAAGLNALAWSWCNRFLTDGRVPRATVVKLMGTALGPADAVALADQLVAVGLWEQVRGGYQIHDFLHYNDSREQVEARRKKEADRKAAWRASHRQDGTTQVAEHDVPPGQGAVDVSHRDKKKSPTGTASLDGLFVPAGHVAEPLSPRDIDPSPRGMSRDSRPVPSRPTESVPLPKTEDARANGTGPTLSKAELDAWRSFGPEWDAFRLAWTGRGLRLPPAGDPDGDDTSQRGLLWQVLDAQPTNLVRWVREAKGKTARDVVAHVLEEWHSVRAEAGLDDETPGMAGGPDRAEAATSLAEIFGRVKT